MNLICKTTRRPDIVFHADGRIEISREAARCLRIKEGDVFTVVRMGAKLVARISIRGGDCHGRHRGACHPTNSNGQHFRAFSVDLYRALVRELGIEEGMKLRFNAGKACRHKDFGSYLPLFLAAAED